MDKKALIIRSFVDSYCLNHFGLNSDNTAIAEEAIVVTKSKIRELFEVLHMPLDKAYFTCKHGSFIVSCDSSMLDRLLDNPANVTVRFDQNFKLS